MRKLRLFLLATFILAATCAPAYPAGASSPVTSSHLLMIESLLRDNKLYQAAVGLDREGRVLLRGQYQDSREVSLAFSLAQSVVGVKWTSPVTPEDVKVREWARKLSTLFPTRKEQASAAAAARTWGKHGVQKYAVVVGVSRFKHDSGGKNRLKYAADDARRVSDYLIRERKYPAENVLLLVDAEATRKNVEAAIDEVAGKAGDADEIFLYFSSHGAPVYDGSLNVVTYDTLFKNHFTMGESSFPSKSLKGFLEGSGSSNVIVVLDVCYSGAAFKGIDGFYHQGAKSITFEDDNQGFSKAAMEQTLLGAKDITLEEDASGRRGGRGAGAKIIMSASDAGERSWESDSIRASFFTHHFLDELRRAKDLKKAFEVSRPRVTSDVRAEKKADQNPQVVTSRRDWGI